jgi:hypothetical protein
MDNAYKESGMRIVERVWSMMGSYLEERGKGLELNLAKEDWSSIGGFGRMGSIMVKGFCIMITTPHNT